MTRVWLVTYDKTWSYGINAQAIADQLSAEFDFAVVANASEVRAEPRDVVVDFWWSGDARHGRLIRQVSSHRWQQGRHGRHDAASMAASHLRDVSAAIVPSLRLQSALAAVVSAPVVHTPKGFDPELFMDLGKRDGDLKVGWAGRVQPDKRVSILRRACPGLVEIGPGTWSGRSFYEEMPLFYNRIDVITCASDAEGDPRPLIEGMACGCFPVTVDVGIVPELVRHGDNGLIVERSPEAFADAFTWCRENLDYVRAAGRRNAEAMLATRTWAQVAPAWADAFRLAAAEELAA